MPRPPRHSYTYTSNQHAIPLCAYSYELTDPANQQSSVPVFRPTWDEFRDFERFVDTVHHVGCYYGLVKVIPPPEWRPYVDDSGDWLGYSEAAAQRMLHSDTAMRVKKPVKQIIRRAYGQKSNESGAYHCLPEYIYKDGGETTVENFYKLAAKQEITPTTRQHKYIHDQDYEALERSIYQSLALNEGSTRTRFYGADSLGSLFPEELKVWNLNALDGPLSGLEDLQGINTSMLYFGRFGSLFAWHGEDCNMHSANFHHMGAAKVWRTVGNTHIHKFDQLVRKFFDSDFRRCDQAMRHKHFIMTPNFLHSHGIQTRVVVQKPGEMVLTFPCTVHCGFNTGININEAVNMVNELWLEDGLRSKRCVCRLKSGAPNLDMNYLIKAMDLQSNERLQELLKQYNLNDANDALNEDLLDVESDTDAVDVLLCPYKRCRYARQALPTVADFLKHLKDKHSNSDDKDSSAPSKEQQHSTALVTVTPQSTSTAVSVIVQQSSVDDMPSNTVDVLVDLGPASGPCTPVPTQPSPLNAVDIINISDDDMTADITTLKAQQQYQCSYSGCSAASRTFHNEAELLEHYATCHTTSSARQAPAPNVKAQSATVTSHDATDETATHTTTVSVTRHFRKRKMLPPNIDQPTLQAAPQTHERERQSPTLSDRRKIDSHTIERRNFHSGSLHPQRSVAFETIPAKLHKQPTVAAPPLALAKLAKPVALPTATHYSPIVPKLGKLTKPPVIKSPAATAVSSIDDLLTDLSNTITSLQRTS